MAPRKPKQSSKSRPLSENVAANVKRLRLSLDLTQQQLADQMVLSGFPNWGRMTVTEVEGPRRRPVSMQEMLGLAELLGVGLDELLWDVDNAALEVSDSQVLLTRRDLQAMLIMPEILAEEGLRIAEPALRKHLGRLTDAYVKRTLAMTEELRSTAAWIEQQLVDSLRGTKEEA
jgi:transcriptional regulator with XRE-family HTH domain